MRIVDTRAVEVDGKRVDLTDKEWTIFSALLHADGSTVRRESLERDLLGFNPKLKSRAVDMTVSRVRSKIGRAAIATVRGLGYRLVR